MQLVLVLLIVVFIAGCTATSGVGDITYNVLDDLTSNTTFVPGEGEQIAPLVVPVFRMRY